MSSAQTSSLSAAVLRVFLVIGVVIVLYYAKGLLLPLTIGALLAMLVNPIDNKLRSWGLPSGLAITGAFFTIILFFAGLFAAVGQQALNFSENWPETKENLVTNINDLRTSLGLESFVPKLDAPGGKKDGSSLASQLPVDGSSIFGFFRGLFGMAGDFMIMLVYVILLLSQKERLREFVLRRLPDDRRGEAQQTLNESSAIVQDYLKGRLILIAILTALYSAGFLIVGLDYAILIALLAAFMSIIPFVGNIIGGVFAAAIAFADGGGSQAVLGIIITMAIAQALESYVLTPLIVGDEVDINPLTTLVCVIGMSIVWGPVGAIVAIPLFAILRIIFSRVDGLRDYAYLLGTEK